MLYLNPSRVLILDKSEKNLHIYNKLGYEEIRPNTIIDNLKLIHMEKANDKRVT